MKSLTTFTRVTKEQLEDLSTQLKGVLSEANLADFNQYVKPYDKFGKAQLDDIYLVAEVTIRGRGNVKSLKPHCWIDQEDWIACEDEADIRINPVDIPFKTLVPALPLEILGATTVLVVLEAEGNIWDSCKDLPGWVWSERSFEFMLSFTIVTEDGKEYEELYDYANQLIKF
jgi:hypothetical protein